MQMRLRRVLRAPPDFGRHRIFIAGYSFPLALRDRVSEAYDPALTSSQATLVFEGLRSWFLACTHANGRMLGMPSKAVDDAWHEFILMTREYHLFCGEAFGHYLHHTPDSAMAESLGDALARTLQVLERHPAANGAAGDEGGLPLLFRIDAELGLEDGYEWSADQVEHLKRGKAGCGGGGSCGGDDGGGGCGGGCGGG